MRRLMLLFPMLLLLVACSSGPQVEPSHVVLELPQPQYNVALAVSGSISHEVLLETAEIISVRYADLDLIDDSTQLGAAVARLFPIEELSQENVSTYVRVLKILDRGAQSRDTSAYGNAVYRLALTSESPRLLADLFEAFAVVADPDEALLRSILDRLYSFSLGEERTAALIRVARLTAEQGGGGGLNAIVQQTIPTLPTTASPLVRVANLVAVSRLSTELDRDSDADFLRSRALRILDTDELRVSQRDIPVLYQCLDDLVAQDEFPVATRIAVAVTPLRSRALAYLYVADRAGERTLLQRSYFDLAVEVIQTMTDPADRMELAGRVLVALSSVYETPMVTDTDSVLRKIEWTGADRAYPLAALIIAGDPDAALEELSKWNLPVSTGYTELAGEVLRLLVDAGGPDQAAAVIAYLVQQEAFTPSPAYALQLMRLGRVTEGLRLFGTIPITTTADRELVVAGLLTMAADYLPQGEERSLLSRILERATVR